MKYSLASSEELRDFIRHLPPELRQKVRQALGEIVQNPKSGKELTDELKGLRSYRIGRIRIVYRLESQTINLITVGPRKTVYQKAALEIKRQLEEKD